MERLKKVVDKKAKKGQATPMENETLKHKVALPRYGTFYLTDNRFAFLEARILYPGYQEVLLKDITDVRAYNTSTQKFPALSGAKVKYKGSAGLEINLNNDQMMIFNFGNTYHSPRIEKDIKEFKSLIASLLVQL